MNALRPHFEKLTGKPIIFVVTHLKVSGNWAYWEGEPKRPGNKPIDWSKTRLKDAAAEGMLDQISMALLRKTGKQWKVAELAIGPTDYPVGEWQKKHKAPKAIFRFPNA